MGIMHDCLQLVLPKGKVWDRIRSDPLFLALGDIFAELRDRIRLIPLEANPGTATYTLPEWHNALGVRYDPTLPIETQRKRLEAINTAVGGMTLRQLQEQINREFANIIVSEVSATCESGVAESGIECCGAGDNDYATDQYEVSGVLENDEEYEHLGAILEHFAPAHLIPFMNVQVREVTESAECGDCYTGLMETGTVPEE